MAGLINSWLDASKQAPEGINEPKWLIAKRQSAHDQLSVLDDPSRKLESWRYADAERITHELSLNNQHPDTKAVVATDESADYTLTIRLNEAGYELSENCPEFIKVNAINAIKSDAWVDVQFDQETVVNLSNTMLFRHGVAIEVNGLPDNKKQLQLRLVYDFANEQDWQYIRNQITVAENCSVKVQEKWQKGRLNLVNVYHLNAAAQLQRSQDMLVDVNAQIVSLNQIDMGDRAHAVTMNQHIGGSLQHHLHRVNFNGVGAEFKLGTINKSFNNSNISDLVEVNHYNKQNRSEVTHRSIANDQSQIFNNAKALVAPGADQSEIEQDLKNILLSENAKIFSKPELEVYADEVVAAHGSTIGALDEQSLFYLQSRGIDIEQAREIMIESFEQEAVVC